MIKFLVKGLFRDKNRSLFPIIIVSFGVMLTTLLFSWMQGVFDDLIAGNAKFDTGHIKVMTKEYYEISNQLPNDLCLTNINSLVENLEKNYPDYDWSPRIKFGGLIDIPDSTGETKTQGPIFGIAVNILNDPDKKEITRLRLKESLIQGRLPENSGEILLSQNLLERLNIKIGDNATIISASSYGGMAIQNFIVIGSVKFGISALDKGAVLADLSDIQSALAMENSCGELLGIRKNGLYFSDEVNNIKKTFNNAQIEKPYSPIMITLEEQNGLKEYLLFAKSAGFMIVFIFVFAMGIVLWNTGLLSGIRRYGEIGIRLAIGESKTSIYKSLLAESFFIGLFGSLIGVIIGISISFYFQEVGFDISDFFDTSGIITTNIIRAKITVTSYYIGFLPGIVATLFGAAISGIAIFKRETASLFKELEA